MDFHSNNVDWLCECSVGLRECEMDFHSNNVDWLCECSVGLRECEMDFLSSNEILLCEYGRELDDVDFFYPTMWICCVSIL